MVADGDGRIGSIIELRDSAAKKDSGRSIPIHRDLAAAFSPDAARIQRGP
jgi:hypothetical protein